MDWPLDDVEFVSRLVHYADGNQNERKALFDYGPLIFPRLVGILCGGNAGLRAASLDALSRLVKVGGLGRMLVSALCGDRGMSSCDIVVRSECALGVSRVIQCCCVLSDREKEDIGWVRILPHLVRLCENGRTAQGAEQALVQLRSLMGTRAFYRRFTRALLAHQQAQISLEEEQKQDEDERKLENGKNEDSNIRKQRQPRRKKVSWTLWRLLKGENRYLETSVDGLKALAQAVEPHELSRREIMEHLLPMLDSFDMEISEAALGAVVSHFEYESCWDLISAHPLAPTIARQAEKVVKPSNSSSSGTSLSIAPVVGAGKTLITSSSSASIHGDNGSLSSNNNNDSMSKSIVQSAGLVRTDFPNKPIRQAASASAGSSSNNSPSASPVSSYSSSPGGKFQYVASTSPYNGNISQPPSANLSVSPYPASAPTISPSSPLSASSPKNSVFASAGKSMVKMNAQLSCLKRKGARRPKSSTPTQNKNRLVIQAAQGAMNHNALVNKLDSPSSLPGRSPRSSLNSSALADDTFSASLPSPLIRQTTRQPGSKPRQQSAPRVLNTETAFAREDELDDFQETNTKMKLRQKLQQQSPGVVGHSQQQYNHQQQHYNQQYNQQERATSPPHSNNKAIPVDASNSSWSRYEPQRIPRNASPQPLLDERSRNRADHQIRSSPSPTNKVIGNSRGKLENTRTQYDQQRRTLNTSPPPSNMFVDRIHHEKQRHNLNSSPPPSTFSSSSDQSTRNSSPPTIISGREKARNKEPRRRTSSPPPEAYPSAEDLKKDDVDLPGNVEGLVCMLENEAEWQGQFAVLNAIKSDQPTKFPKTCLYDPGLIQAVVKLTSNLRSSLCKCSLVCLHFLIKNNGIAFWRDQTSSLVDSIVTSLVKKSIDASAFLAQEAKNALGACVECLPPAKLSTSILQHCHSHPNAKARSSSAEVLLKLVQSHPSCSYDSTRVVQCAKEKLLHDKNVSARAAAKGILTHMNEIQNLDKKQQLHLHRIKLSAAPVEKQRRQPRRAGSNKSLASSKSSSTLDLYHDHLEGLQSPHWQKRIEAIVALQQIISESPTNCLPLLDHVAERAHDPNTRVKIQAIDTLNAIIPSFAERLDPSKLATMLLPVAKAAGERPTQRQAVACLEKTMQLVDIGVAMRRHFNSLPVKSRTVLSPIFLK